MRISLKSLLPVMLVSVFTAAQVMADYVSATSRTNLNQQTDLFKTSIEDLKSLEQQLEAGKTSATQGLEGSPKALEFISDKSKDELESGASDLSSIRAVDLADKGRREMTRDNILEEIYFDETKPLYMEHKKYTDSIAEASSKMLGNLLGMLKELGVDCKAVKGNKVVEPEYFIDIKKSQTKDTVYNKTICEELRNSYNCRDILTLKCNRKAVGIKEFKKIIVSLTEIMHLFVVDPRDGKPTNLLNAFSCDQSIERLRKYLIEKVGDDQIEVPPQGAWVWPRLIIYHLNDKGEKGKIQNTWHPEAEPQTGTVKLYYYQGQEDSCSEWQEDLEERCNLQ